jgi:type IV pilus assembly protein PilB
MSIPVEAAASYISRTQVGVVTRLTPRSALTDEQNIAELIATVVGCIADGHTRIVIDLAQVPTVTSQVLETFLDLQEDLLRAGGWIKLASANAILQDVFRFTGLNQQIAVLKSFGAEQDEPAKPYPQESRQRLGDILVARGLLSRERIEEAIAVQKKNNKQLAQILIGEGWVSEQQVLEALSDQLSVPYVKLRAGLFDPAVVDLLSKETARRLRVMPLFKVRGEVTLATAQPQAIPILREAEEAIGIKVRAVLALEEDILQQLSSRAEFAGLPDDFLAPSETDLLLVESAIPDDYSTIDEIAAGSPVINLVNSLIQRAVSSGASDIHIEPFRTISRVRLRIDGILYEIMTPRVELHPALVSRLKVMASLDIAERRLPQDGRIQVHTQGRTVDLRFSSLPGLFGEKVVLRVLDKNQAILDLNKLGMSKPHLDTYRSLLGRGYGLILATGPTGSGKTTTLYAALNELNSLEKSIVTIEDPVEYQMEVINQNEVREKVGLTFAKVLKHVLRQDPDIVMVGEIRERQTAEIAVQAALTGHLVLSTLHTNDSIGAITRLIDMGVEPYLLSSALIGVIAQRLVRTVCQSCKTTYVAAPELVQQCGWESDKPIRLARGRGCKECFDSGFRGRIAIHETLQTDQELQRLIVSNPSRDQLNEYLGARGITNLFADGLDRVRQQLTTPEEVGRVVSIG